MTPSELTTLVDETVKEVSNPKARGMAKSIAIDPSLNAGVLAMMDRASEMRSPITALLAGIAAVPAARRMWEDSLDETWERNRVSPSKLIPEVVIGSGLTAAIYCAMRVSMGYEPPIVLEQGPRAGGTFAVSRGPSFYLNSRNRPGELSIPRNQGALNFLPGSMVQPSDLGNEEYQVNSDLAFAIRSVFALTGVKVVPNVKVSAVLPERRFVGYSNGSRGYEYYARIYLEDDRKLKASRVIVATGIGEERSFWSNPGPKLLNFSQFMAMLDQPFPLRGMRRVAVIGAGDSGKCVVEALAGQGPSGHMSVASLDWPEEIVWYGQRYTTREDFEECNRPRYARIGSLLVDNGRLRRQRLFARPAKVTYVDEGYNCVLVDGEPFDLAVNCSGIAPNAGPDGYTEIEGLGMYRDYARYAPMNPGDVAYRIFYAGPAARIPRSAQENLASPLPDNDAAAREALVAAYRYAGRTAMLARVL